MLRMVVMTIIDKIYFSSVMTITSGIWYSRRKLSVICIIILILIVSIEYRKRAIILTNGETVKKTDFMDDLDYGIEKLTYMYDMQHGTAEIRAVVEGEQKVKDYYWWCYIDRFKNVSEAEWTKYNDELYLYSAYLDIRKNSLYPRNNAIQVLSVSFGSMKQKVFCYIFDETSHSVVEGYIREIWQRGWDPRDNFYNVNLITCPIPKRLEQSAKMFVSISMKLCQSQQSALRVHIPPPAYRKEVVAVCVKGMDFEEEISSRLVEWLEAQYLLGVSTVTIYKYTVSQSVQNVLAYYERLGKLVQVALPL